MGLDTTHNCWHGSYRSFNNWRREICKSASLGILDEYVGFGGDKYFDPNDALTILLYHSDCDGDIKWQDCNNVADRLEEVLPDVTHFYGEVRDGYYVDKTNQFIGGLREAYELQEDVGFH